MSTGEAGMSATAHRILSNTAYQLIGQVFHLLLNIVVMAMVARYLGAEGFGKYTFIFVLLSLFAILTDFGINDIVVRELSKDKSLICRVVYDLFCFKFVLGILAIGFSIAAVFILGYSPQICSCFIWASVSLLLMSFASISTIVFRVNLWMKRNTVAIVTKDIFLLLLTYAAIVHRCGLPALIWASVAANFVNLCVSLVLIGDVIRIPRTPFNRAIWEKIGRSALPLGFACLVVTLYAGIDTLLLEHMVGQTAVGYYNAAYKFVYQAIFIPVALVNSIFPFMADYWNKDRERLKVLFQKAYDSMVIVAIPLAAVVTVIAPKLITLIYGEGFSPSVPSLQILIWAVAVMFQGIICGYMMIAINEQKTSLYIDILALLLNIILNIILIPKLTFIGTSIVTLLTEIFAIVPTIYIIQKRLEYTLSIVCLLKSLVIGALCALLLVISYKWNLIVQAGICLSGYAALAYYFKLIPEEVAQQLWRKASPGRVV